jgi:hypothetical protein
LWILVYILVLRNFVLEKVIHKLNLDINLIGVAPENVIEYPKLGSDELFSSKTLTNGHSHFILLGRDDLVLKWGDETKFKMQLVERLANGRKGFSYKCKVVGLVVGNIPTCEDEINYFVEKNWPLILIEDSEVSQIIKELRNNQTLPEANESNYILTKELMSIAKYSKILEIEDDSENLASAVHICLTISF